MKIIVCNTECFYDLIIEMISLALKELVVFYNGKCFAQRLM